MAALQAQTEMDPSVAHFQTFLAALRMWLHRANLVEVRTLWQVHPSFESEWPEYEPRLRAGRGGFGVLRAYHRNVHQMLGEEPDLQLVAANHLTHQQIVGAIVSCVGGLFSHGAGFFQNDFMSFQ